MELISKAGRKTLDFFSTFRDVTSLFYDMVTRMLFNRETHITRSQVINQILFIGLDALILTLILAVGLGTLTTHQLVDNGANIQATSFFGKLMVVIIKDISPIVTAIVVVGRSGSAFTTFLGNMQVTRETDALKAMGISTIDFLCIPSFIGMIISLICLNFYFSIAATLSGVYVALYSSQVPFVILLSQILTELNFLNIIESIVKCITFGVIISTISSYHGLAVRSIRIVPRAVFRTVVSSIAFVIFSNIIITVLFIYLKDFLFHVSR